MTVQGNAPTGPAAQTGGPASRTADAEGAERARLAEQVDPRWSGHTLFDECSDGDTGAGLVADLIIRARA